MKIIAGWGGGWWQNENNHVQAKRYISRMIASFAPKDLSLSLLREIILQKKKKKKKICIKVRKIAISIVQNNQFSFICQN